MDEDKNDKININMAKKEKIFDEYIPSKCLFPDKYSFTIESDGNISKMIFKEYVGDLDDSICDRTIEYFKKNGFNNIKKKDVWIVGEIEGDELSIISGMLFELFARLSIKDINGAKHLIDYFKIIINTINDKIVSKEEYNAAKKD